MSAMKNKLNEPNHLPLVVDLDGTLVRVDTTHEILFRTFTTAPYKTLRILFRFRHERAKLKIALLELVDLSSFTFPINSEIASMMQREVDSGRTVVVATGATESVASYVTQKLPFKIGAVYSSTETLNLIGTKKAQFLNEKFGSGKYLYAGNSKEDVHVFKSAFSAVLVNFSSKHERNFKIAASFSRRNGFLAAWRAARPWQWSKNMLILLPLLAAMEIPDGAALKSFIAFISFSFLASSVYILNDLVDLNSDRLHADKKTRSFASGDLTIVQGLGISVSLGVAAFLISVVLAPALLNLLIAYFVITAGYTLYFKRLLIIDTLLLASLYCLRVIVGGVASEIPISFWLLSLVFTLFVSLSVLKRFAEVSKLDSRGKQVARGRGYSFETSGFLLSMGLSTGLSSIIVLMTYLYLNVQSGAKGEEKYLLLIVCLYWVAHIWMQAVKGRVGGDPVFFALRDKVSLASLIIVALLWMLPSQNFDWLI